MRVREVVLWGILCVSFAEPHFMGTMNFTRICLRNIILVIYAKGNNQANHVLNRCAFILVVQTVRIVVVMIFALLMQAASRTI